MVSYFLSIAIVLLTICLVTSMELDIQFVYMEGFIQFNILTFYNLKFFRFKIKSLNTNNKTNTNGKNNISKSNFLNIINSNLIYYICDRVILKKVIWNTKIGLEDAALLSIIYGFIWNFKTSFLRLILKNKKIKIIHVDVFPIFNQNILDIKFNCIFQIKLVHIIVVWLWLLRLNKGGDKIDRTSNRRLNENYNE